MRNRTAIPFLAVVLSASTAAGVCIAADKTDDKPRVNEARVAELTESIKSNPDDSANYRLRAFEYGKGHAWEKAAADFVQVAKLRGGNSQIAQKIGVFLVLAGDKKTHETLCREMIEGFSDSTQRGDLERTAKVCTLMPEPVGKLTDLEELSRRSIELSKNRDFACHHYRTLALVLNRMKKYDVAIEAVHAADKADADARVQIPNVIVCDRAIEAICLVRSGKLEQAKTVLAKATPTLNEAFQDQTKLYKDEYWHDWLIAKVLYDEAQQLIARQKN